MSKTDTIERLQRLVAAGRKAQAAVDGAIAALAKTPAERKAAERDRNRKAGFVLKHVWVHKRDVPRFVRVMDRLNKKRGM